MDTNAFSNVGHLIFHWDLNFSSKLQAIIIAWNYLCDASRKLLRIISFWFASVMYYAQHSKGNVYSPMF